MKELYNISFLRLAVITLLFSFTACTHSMIGKTLPVRNYPQFENKAYGHHLVKFEKGKAELEYDWTINQVNNMCTLKGTYNIYSADWKAVTYSSYQTGRLVIEIYILNNKYEVVRIEQVVIQIDERTYESNKFEKTFLYKPEYKYLSYKILFSAQYGL